jgi:hypothetical protein
MVEKGRHISAVKQQFICIQIYLAPRRGGRSRATASRRRGRRRTSAAVMHRRTGESGFPRASFPGSFRLMREVRAGRAIIWIFPRRVYLRIAVADEGQPGATA